MKWGRGKGAGRRRDEAKWGNGGGIKSADIYWCLMTDLGCNSSPSPQQQ